MTGLAVPQSARAIGRYPVAACARARTRPPGAVLLAQRAIPRGSSKEAATSHVAGLSKK